MNASRITLSIVASGLLTLLASANGATRTVALTGQHPPGTPAGTTYEVFGFSPPVINGNGQVAFNSRVNNPAAPFVNDYGVWAEAGSVLTKAAFEGDAAPDTAGTFVNITSPRPFISNTGQVVFRGSTASEAGIWMGPPGSARLVVTDGSQAPGTDDGSGTMFANFGTISVDAVNGSQLAFDASLSGPGSDLGIWQGNADGLDLVVREGDELNHLPPGITVKEPVSPLVNTSGAVTYRGFPTSFVSGEAGIWVNSIPGNIYAVNAVLSENCCFGGDPAPGVVGPAVFDQVGDPAFNNSGHVAFHGQIKGTGISSANDRGIWAGPPENFSLVAREGATAPGTGNAASFSAFEDPLLSAAERLAFTAQLAGGPVDSTNDFGIWAHTTGGLSLVAREGDAAPGTGAVFQNLDGLPLVINSAGQVAFLAYLTGAGVTTANNHGIWALDSVGTLQLVVRAGDQLEVAPGDVRTIHSLEFLGGSGNEDGRRSGFSNNGLAAFKANFDGASGIFVSDVVMSTTPGGLPGDYNEDGVVNAADYVVWRNQNGTDFDLPNRGLGLTGNVGQADYEFWVANFGETLDGSAAGAHAAVPEPAAAGLLLVALLAQAFPRNLGRRSWVSGII